MPVASSSAVHEPDPPLAIPPESDQSARSFDARWVAWIARGREHDLAVKRNLRIAALGGAVMGLSAALSCAFAGGAR